MHQIIAPDQMKIRIDRLGLSASRLALMAGVSHSTITRSILSGDSMGLGLRTLSKVSRALISHELRLRDYLLGLHPVEATPPAPALEAAE